MDKRLEINLRIVQELEKKTGLNLEPLFWFGVQTGRMEEKKKIIGEY